MALWLTISPRHLSGAWCSKCSRESPKRSDGGNITRIPKLDIPTFNGEILNWQKFWDQFAIVVHNQKNISNAERLLYLEQAVHGGPAAKAIEGLSRTGAQYEQAFEHLKIILTWCFVNESEIFINLEPTKNGSGRELHWFHEAMGKEDYYSFIMACWRSK